MSEPSLPELLNVPPEVQAEFDAALNEYERELRAFLDKLQEIGEAINEYEQEQE